MVVREQASSSHSLGFRVDGIIRATESDQAVAVSEEYWLLLAGWLDGWMDGWLDGWLDGWMAGWLDGWLAGWMAVT
jgi:hypothetical protein